MPLGAVAYRGILIDTAGAVVIKKDTGQARSFVGGVAVEAATGILLVNGTATPNLIPTGGLLRDQNGSVQVTVNAADLIHQGVGLLSTGALSCSNVPA